MYRSRVTLFRLARHNDKHCRHYVQTAVGDCVDFTAAVVAAALTEPCHVWHLIAISRRTLVITFIHYETDADPRMLAVRLPLAICFLPCHIATITPLQQQLAVQNCYERHNECCVHETRNAWQSLACSPRGIPVTPLENR